VIHCIIYPVVPLHSSLNLAIQIKAHLIMKVVLEDVEIFKADLDREIKESNESLDALTLKKNELIKKR
jgi:hypothetical protein